MAPSRFWLSLLLVGFASSGFASSGFAQGKRDAHVIYKDGFVIKGRVEEKTNIIYDAANGRPFVIPTGNFHIDDYVRRVYFSPANVAKVFQFKQGELKEPIKLTRFSLVFQNLKFGESFRIGVIPPWDETAERTVPVANVNKLGTSEIPMHQKIGIISSQYITAVTEKYPWNLAYFTSEFKPDLTRKILVRWLDTLKDYKNLPEHQKALLLANFMHEAGWHDQAEEELHRIIIAFPKEKKTAEEVLATVRASRANWFVDGIERRAKSGQHLVALDLLESYDRQKMKDIVKADNQIKALDLQAKYDKAKTDMEDAKGYLKRFGDILRVFPAWKNAAEFIAAELNHDTIGCENLSVAKLNEAREGRLDVFNGFAQQYFNAVKENRKPAQKPEEVMALAVTGWLQGPKAAEPDVKFALKLLAARTAILTYLGNDNGFKRADSFKSYNDLPADVIARLITMIPPAKAHDVIDTSIQTIKIEAPNAGGGSYLLKLPPDYHHLRSYPVMVALHSSREPAEEMVKQLGAEAAKHGYILAVPQWVAKGARARYSFSDAEHALVLDTLRDLRRRFQVDSDRVGLFGWEDGGTYAFDVGLAHPDQFCGVIPMNGVLSPFTRRFYWPNAQYLPFYVIDGERNVIQSTVMQDLYKKEWTRPPYQIFFVEYKGRGNEWYTPEVEKMFDWISRKKRHTPMKEMGRQNVTTTRGEEFQSSREGDNRFYWLRAEQITKLGSHSPGTFDPRFLPATFQANLSHGNKNDVKGANIWNQVNIRVSGVRQTSFMITQGMMNLEFPLQVVFNGQKLGGPRTITPSVEVMMDELHQSGDRQRLYVAKVEMK